MAKNILEELKERGLVKQTIYEEELSELLSNNKVVCYCGFDPTAESLHIGNLVALLTLRRMQMAGHTPIALVGGATGRIGDPSFRNDMRPMMTEEQRLNNVAKIKAQIESFFDPNAENKLIVVNNDDWIGQLKYVDFLNDVGIHFSVNRMLSHECFKSRMETGLSFLEFNYMPMQGYDFLHLFRNYNCVYELGGDDQWANIIAGVDLIRRKESKPAFASTIPLLTKADGTKMGKSAGGAVWLDGNKFSDYDFYQYIRNIEDSKVEEIFKMLTFLPLDEIKEICNVKGKEINQAKERLAYEVTKIVRGEENAKKAMEQA
ncbi:MAG: tyrosine--tRNA ligase, partial [Clostridia bacterium]|nr:tyrosine--tRNA ligase [Clostridia bacterium]